MLNWNSYSIRKQLIFLFIIVQLILVLFLILYYNYSQRQSYLLQLEGSLFNQATLLKESLRSNDINIRNIDKWTKKIGQKINKRITIINQSGIVIADSEYEVKEMDNHLGRPEVQAVLSGKESGISIRQSNTLNIDMYYLAVAVNNQSLTGFIRLSKSLEDIKDVINVNIRRNILFFILILFLTLLLVWKLTIDIINPLSQITEMAGKMAEGNFQEKIVIKANDNEIGTLARAFNFMASQLETRINQISDEKNRAEAILTSMVDGLLATDKNLNIKLINPAAMRIFSINDKQLKEKRTIEVFRYHEIEYNLKKAMAENSLFTDELQTQGENKKILKCNFVAINNDQGQVIGGIAVFNDITELRRLEKLRKDFVGNVSHELRTPLTSIIGYVDTLLDNEINDQKTISRFLKIIKKEADRLALLIKDLLDLSKLESKSKYILRPGILNQIIEKAVLLLEDRAREKEIIIERKIRDDLLVYMVPEQIEQVLINLLENAIKYTPVGGKVIVKAFSIANKAVVEIIDDGIGITGDEQERIFERFYRVDKARSRALGGTGIGLSIVKHILHNHQSNIEVESELGKGSVFRFSLDRVHL